MTSEVVRTEGEIAVVGGSRLDDEDASQAWPILKLMCSDKSFKEIPVLELFQALETLRTHLRKKYYAG